MIRRLASMLDRVLAGLEAVFVLCALASLVVLSTWQVIARNLGQPSPGWVDPFLHQMVMWAGLLGASLAVRTQAHIRFELLGRWLSPAWNARLGEVLRAFSAFICVLLGRASIRFVLGEQARDAEIAGIPAWIYTLVIPAAFFLMAAHFLLAPRDLEERGVAVDAAQPGLGEGPA